MSHDALAAEYEALNAGAGMVDLSGRTQVELRGDDRATLLHNLCTNDVRRLAAGQGCEALLLDLRGHVQFHVFVFAGHESLVLDTVAAQGSRLVAHLDRYVIRERVELHDRGEAWGEWLVAGRRAEELVANLADAALPRERCQHRALNVGGVEADWRRVDITPSGGWLVSAPRARLATLAPRLAAAGVARCGEAAFQAARIAAGAPLWGLDISDKNLPQELARDAQLISFVKGCYLGQETVARIDALGHVNRLLVGLRFAGASVPAAGTELSSGGQSVGQVTSAAFSPGERVAVGLAYVRRGCDAPGTRLESSSGPADVVRTPMVVPATG